MLWDWFPMQVEVGIYDLTTTKICFFGLDFSRRGLENKVKDDITDSISL